MLVLPGHLFYTERLEVPKEVADNEIDAFAELSMEAASPFPLEQLNWGYQMDADARGLFLFATHRDRLKQCGFTHLETYLWVLPDFAAVGDIHFADATELVLETAQSHSVVEYASADRIPQQVQSYAHEHTAKVGAHPATAIASCQLTPTGIDLSEAGLPTFSFSTVAASDSNPELTATRTYSPDEASMWRADVRSTAFKESERSKRQMSERLGRSTVWAALVAIGLLVLEGILLGGQAWLSAKQARISEQTAPVAKIEEQRSLISKLEQVFQNEVRPIAILEALNTVRPRGIYFTSTTTDIENHITIEGVAQAINELNSYTDTLKKSGRFVLTSDPKSLTRSGKTSFTVTLAYRPDEAPATTQRSK